MGGEDEVKKGLDTGSSQQVAQPLAPRTTMPRSISWFESHGTVPLTAKTLFFDPLNPESMQPSLNRSRSCSEFAVADSEPKDSVSVSLVAKEAKFSAFSPPGFSEESENAKLKDEMPSIGKDSPRVDDLSELESRSRSASF